MTEQQADDLRRAAWRINRLCALLSGQRHDEGVDEAIEAGRDSAARLREIAGPVPIRRGNGG